MKNFTFTIILSLFFGTTTAEGKGNFRHIYESDDKKVEKIKKSMAYVKNKMESVHNLDMKKNGSFEWDFYLFKKFVKSAPKAPPLLSDEPRSAEGRYHFFRLSTFFSLRSCYSLYEPKEDFHIFMTVKLQLELAENGSDDPHVINAGREWFKTKAIKEKP